MLLSFLLMLMLMLMSGSGSGSSRCPALAARPPPAPSVRLATWSQGHADPASPPNRRRHRRSGSGAAPPVPTPHGRRGGGRRTGWARRKRGSWAAGDQEKQRAQLALVWEASERRWGKQQEQTGELADWRTGGWTDGQRPVPAPGRAAATLLHIGLSAAMGATCRQQCTTEGPPTIQRLGTKSPRCNAQSNPMARRRAGRPACQPGDRRQGAAAHRALPRWAGP